MKNLFKISFAALLLGAFASCSEAPEEQSSFVPEFSKEDISAEIVTRTLLGDENKVLWTEGDAIAFFNKSTMNLKYALKAGANTTSATFGYVSYTGTHAALTTNYAVYPWSEGVAIDEANRKVTGLMIAGEQNYTVGQPLLNGAPMVAQSTTRDFSFQNTIGLVRVNVKSELPSKYELGAISFESATHLLSGKAEASLEDYALTITEGEKSVEVTLAENAAVMPDQAVESYALLPATTFAAGDLTITLHLVDLWEGTAVEVVKVVPAAVVLKRSEVFTFNITVKEEDVTGSTEDFADGVALDADGNFVVTTGEGLAWIAENLEKYDGYADQTITLNGNIDLSAPTTRSLVSNWTSIGTEENPFVGTFDGKGFTIKNLTIVEPVAKEGKAFIGFFGYAKNATIKNVTFENVDINVACLDIDHSQGHIGAVAGSLEGTSLIENVTVKGNIKVEATVDANGASRVAVVAGGNSYGNVTMTNVHVIANEGSYLKANNNTGALAGQLQGKSVFENCSSNIDVTVNKFFAGGIIGLAAGDQLFTNCHTTGNIAVVAGREGRAHDQYRVGGIAGGWADGKTKVCTLVNCSYSGQISGKNSDGSVANPLDYLGYVGRGYTLNGCQGSKVVIDGISFVQKYDTAAQAGIYEVTGVDGESVVVATSKEDLPKTDDGTKIDTKFEENTLLYGDIDLSAGETNANSGYGATGVLVANGAVLDGQGNTLTVEDANGTWDCAINAKSGTIKNLTVKGAMRGIFMGSADGDIYIDNVTFTDVIYTFNSDGGNKNYGVYLSNCVINGWTSHSDVHKEVVYTNCKFGEGCGYAFCRPYGPTVYENCDFSTDMQFDTTQQSNIVFRNCTYGGVKITAENAASLKTGEVTLFYNGVGSAVFE